MPRWHSLGVHGTGVDSPLQSPIVSKAFSLFGNGVLLGEHACRGNHHLEDLHLVHGHHVLLQVVKIVRHFPARTDEVSMQDT